MASIARKNLIEDLPRFLVAQAGILFAVSLVTLQTGLYKGFAKTASQLIERSRADIWVASDNIVHLGFSIPLTYERRTQAAAVAGVEGAEALILRGTAWRSPDNKLAAVTLVGFEPTGTLFTPPPLLSGNWQSLNQPYRVVVDTTSLEALDAKGMGTTGIISALPGEITGITQGTQSLIFGNLVFTTLESAQAYVKAPLIPQPPCTLVSAGIDCVETPDDYPPTPSPLKDTDAISFVLVKAKPGTTLRSLQQQLRAALPNTRVLTQSEMIKLNQRYWQERSGIGFVLGLGAVVGIVVGVVVVGQILYASISEHLKEFGTLKAMGASNWFIYRVIGEQALWMAVLGYLPSMGLCLAVSAWAASTQGILILITPVSALSILGITIAMCLSAALVAAQQVIRVDPAIVFKG